MLVTLLKREKSTIMNLADCLCNCSTEFINVSSDVRGLGVF